MTILLIDADRNEHEMFREVIRRINPNHKCLKAFSSESALDSLLEEESELPDLIFLDLALRAGDGTETLKILKESTVLKEIPVCIYTTSTKTSDRETTQRMGAIGYVLKERNLTTLTESIVSIIASQNLN